MKRNFAEISNRTTAGCLPVPLFNQKKRNRQPLTSNPLQNEPDTGNSADSFDFSAMLADFGWEMVKPELTQLQRTRGTNPTDFPVPPSLLQHQNTSNSANVSSAGNSSNWRQEEKNAGGNLWKRQDFPSFGKGRENRKILQPADSSNCLAEAMPQKSVGHLKVSQGGKSGRAEQSYSTAIRRPAVLNNTPRVSQRQSTSYIFKPNPCQEKVNEKTAAHTDGKTIQKKGQPYQVKWKEKENSLRIVSAVIESMKHWSQYADKTPLLFEILGVLDSAVTPGSYGAKTFLLRDGKENLSCVFYEIDRELPRLIRGRIHRCVGNYDAKRNIFKCVSVRPATVAEQQTFQDFVQIADAAMGKYVKTSNEI